MNKQQVTIGNSWFAPVLGLIFVTLKLTNVIDWPWLWVLAPFWIPIAFAVAVLLIVASIVAIKTFTDK